MPLWASRGRQPQKRGGVTYSERHDRAAGLVHRCRFVNDLPLHGSRADVRVHVLADWERGQDTEPPVRWMTDLRGRTRPVYKRMRGGRARWKSDNETCNPLTTHGDNCEHNDGHGEKNLSVVVALLLLLAVVVEQTPPLCGAVFQAVWAKLGRKRLVWACRRSRCYPYALESRRHRLAALFDGWKRLKPICAIAASSSPAFLCEALASTG
jgi:hypothetical protein